MHYHVNEDVCIGCGLCAETCPEVFSLRDDGFAEAAPGPVPESAQETAAEAMDEMCIRDRAKSPQTSIVLSFKYASPP